MAVADVAARLGQGVDEVVEHLGFEVLVADDGAAVGAGDVRDGGQLPQQVLELGFAVFTGAAEAFQDAAAHRFPEAGGVQQFDDEEESAAGLHALADLAEQVGLARAGLPADRDAQRGGVWVTQGVAERVHDVLDGAFVEPVHVGGLRAPQIVAGGRPGEAKRGERVAMCILHQLSMLIRCLA